MYVCVGAGRGQYFRSWEYSSNRNRHSPFSQRALMVNEKMEGTKVKRSVRRVLHGYALKQESRDLVSSVNLLFVHEEHLLSLGLGSSLN